MASNMRDGEPLEIIRFKDAVGRKFSFPFEMVREWSGMEDLIKSAFLHVDVLGPHVQEGHYDLSDPEGEIILPATWKHLVRPGMAVTMSMWPMDKAPRVARPPMFKPGVPPYYNAPPGPPKPVPMPMPIPPRPNIINVDRKPPAHSKNPHAKNSAVLTFLTGKPVKKKASKTVDKSESVRSSSPPARPAWHSEKNASNIPGTKTGFNSGPASTPHRFSAAPRPGMGMGMGMPPPPGARMPPPPMAGRKGKSHIPPPPSFSSGSSSSSSDDDTSSESSDEESDGAESIRSRSVARKAGLILQARRQAQEQRFPRRQLTMPILESNPTPMERNEFSSARLYPDELGPISVALELTKYSNPPGGSSTTGENERITWLHVSRTIMDFSEFENIALHGGNLTTNPDSQLAMQSIFKAIHDKKMKRSRSNWYVEPGTVLRCDVDSGGKTVASAVFASIPQVQVDAFTRSFNIKFRKGICVPRKLHEVFNPYDTSFERDKNQFFRKHDGAAADQILWLCETWVLIVDSGQVFTYGDPRRRSALQENIDIREQYTKLSDEKFVQVTTPEHLQFQIPLKRCETFFKLQSSVVEQLAAAMDKVGLALDNSPDVDEIQLLSADGEPLTARTWSKLIKQPRQTLIHVKAEWINDGSSSSSSSSSSLSGYRDSASSTKSSVHMSEKGADDDEFFGIRKISTPESTEAPSLPDYHPKVPPFLGWSILEASTPSANTTEINSKTTSDEDQAESIRACLIRTEIALAEHHHPFVADLQQKFPDLNFNPTIMQVGIENIEMHIQNLSASKKKPNRSQSSNLDNEGLHQLYRQYLSASIRALEAFAPKGHSSQVLSFYYDALSKGTQYLKSQDAPESDQKWVISRVPIPLPGLKYEYNAARHVACHSCEIGIIYDTVEEAIAHLRQKHFSETTSEVRLREYLLPLSAAADERLKKEFTEFLTTSRDTMIQIIKEARELQDGVVFGDRFRQPAQGVPYALLNALQVLIAFVCSVPLLMEAMHSYYRNDVLQDSARSLAFDSDLQEKYRYLKMTGSEITTLMKSAERALITSEENRKNDDVAKFFSSVGAHGLAMQLISNILQESVFNNSNVAELYRGYEDNFGSQIIRRPHKRYIPQILALMDEIRRFQQVAKWQRKVLRSLLVVLNPDTHIEPLVDSRRKTYRIEAYIIEETIEKLHEQSQMYKANLARDQELIDIVEGITEITKDDQNRAIFVFTVVTVTFLPLSFVAAYMSMNGGPSNPDWVDTQVLFWQISAPLAVLVGVFCVSVAWQGLLKASWLWARNLVERSGLFARFFSDKADEPGSPTGTEKGEELE